ncbi:MAG: hypothetical protein LBD72_02305 [Puniceicoccales bacterium]|jgi:hypothetical protein|nr:hypothetical protein [Puniceicoccales bacterium]
MAKLIVWRTDGFLLWCRSPSHGQQSANFIEIYNFAVFITALSGDGFKKKIAMDILRQLYNVDNGVTMRDKFLYSANVAECVGGNNEACKFGIIEYACAQCFPDAAIAILHDYYD